MCSNTEKHKHRHKERELKILAVAQRVDAYFNCFNELELWHQRFNSSKRQKTTKTEDKSQCGQGEPPAS